MRFTATSKFNSIAKGAAKFLQWKVYVKKTNALDEALNAGTWIDVTTRVSAIPPVRSKVEYQLGAFTSDSIQLLCSDIDWWEANALNVAAGEGLELLVTAQIGLSASDLATDIVYAFSGWVDLGPGGIGKNERDDTLSVKASTADDLANGMTAEAIVTRYVDSDVDGAGKAGLILKNIFGLYVTDANVTSYVLKPGLHTITYDYNSGTERAKLDDGDWVELPTSDGTVELTNKVTDAKLEIIDQKLELFVDVSALMGTVDTVTETIIVKTAGDTLPYQWYRGIKARVFLKKCFDEFGITTQTFDTMECGTYDGDRWLSFLDIPPDNLNETGSIRAMAVKSDETLYIAVDTKVYSRVYNTDTYTLLGTMASNVDRLFYDATNNWLWIVYGAGTKVKVYKFASATLSAEQALGVAADLNGIDKFEPNDSIVYTTTSDTIRQLKYDGTTFTDSELFNAGSLTPAFTSIGTWGRIVEGETRFLFNGVSSAAKTLHYITWNGSAWVEGADWITYAEDFTVAAYSDLESELYYWNAANSRIKGLTTSAEVTVVTIAGETCEDMIYDSATSKAYFTTLVGGYLYSIASEVATVEFTSTTDPITTLAGTLCSNADYVFGIGQGRRLWQFSTTLAFYLKETITEGQTIKQALTKACQAFNLMYHVSSIKAAYVYRRGNDSGTPQTSGNNVTVNTDLAEDLSVENLYGKAFDLISIDNGTEKHTYDGTAGPVVFDKGVFGDKRILEITNDWIPTELIKHLLYRMWQFFKTDRSLYRMPLGVVPLFQYEIMDQVTASFSSSKISVSGGGPILAQTLYQDGSIDVEALI